MTVWLIIMKILLWWIAGDWNNFGQGYSDNQGGGPMRGQYGGNQRGGAPYGGKLFVKGPM